MHTKISCFTVVGLQKSSASDVYGLTDFILNPLPSNLDRYPPPDTERSPKGPAAAGPHGWSPIHPQDEYTPVFCMLVTFMKTYIAVPYMYL